MIKQKTSRFILFFIVTWMLVWACVGAYIFDREPFGYVDTENGLVRILYVFLLISLLIGWLIIGYYILVKGECTNAKLSTLVREKTLWRYLAFVTPGLLWVLSFLLLRTSSQLDSFWGDGPILLLICSGVYLFLKLRNTLGVKPSGYGSITIIDESPGVKRNTGETLIVVFTLLAIILFLFRDALFNPNCLVAGEDVTQVHYMFEGYVRDTLWKGKLPLWNPYIFSGYPVLAHPQLLVFYPPQLLFRLLPLNLSFSWSIAFHVFIAGISMYALSQKIGLRFFSALTMAVAYMLSGGLFQRVYAGHLFLVYAIAWFPLTFLMFIRAYESDKWRTQISAGFCVALLILTGHPAIPLYAMIFLGLYWLYRVYLGWLEQRSLPYVVHALSKLTLICAFGLSLCAIQLVPTIVLQQQTAISSGYTVSSSNFLSLSITDLLAIFFPQFYVNTDKQLFFWELVPSIGFVFLLFGSLVFLSNQKKSLILFLGCIVILSLLIAFGPSLGFYTLLYFIFPLLRIARVPPRSLFLWIPSLLLIGGMGLQMLQDGKLDKLLKGRFRSILLAAAMLLIGLSIAYISLPTMDYIWQNQKFGLALVLQAMSLFGLISLVLSLIRIHSTCRPWSVTGITVLLGFFLLGLLTRVLFIPDNIFPNGYISRFGVVRMWLTFAFFLLIFSLLMENLGRTREKQFLILLLIIAQSLELAMNSYRLINIESTPVLYENERLLLENAELSEFDRILAAQYRNRFMLQRISNVDGYNPGMLADYSAFISGVSKDTGTNMTSLLEYNTTVDARALDFLGVKYQFSPFPLDDAMLELVKKDDTYYLYRNLDAIPRANMVYDTYIVNSSEAALRILLNPSFDYAVSVVLHNTGIFDIEPDGQSDVVINQYEPSNGSYDMTVTTAKNGVLVISEPYFSERRIWVDGKEVPVLKANIGFMAIPVPGGKHHIELKYVPKSLYTGALITMLTLIVGVGVVFAEKLRILKSKPI